MRESRLLDTLVSASGLPLSEWSSQYPEHRAVAVLCSCVPDEILHAAGLAPVHVRATAAPGSNAGTRLPSYSCSVCRAAMEQAMAGDLGTFAGAVFAHGCDTMQALVDLWRISSAPEQLFEAILLPGCLGSTAARQYLITELERLRAHMGQFCERPISEQDLRVSIVLYDETRRLVQTLQQNRAKLHATDFLTILRAAQAMPRSVFNRLLASLLAELGPAPSLAGGPRLFLAGAVLDAPWLTDLVEELGAQVTGDDLCSGSRQFHGQVGSEGDPIAALANHFLQRPPCPARRSPSHDPGMHLLAQLRQTRSEAVLFLPQKYCDPHAFQNALLRPILEQSGVPSLVLELEDAPNLEGLRTRLQAFLEML